jgi:hypothetical protein
MYFRFQKHVEKTSGGDAKKLITIDPRSAQQIQRELVPDETMLWADMPNPKIIFHSDGRAVIPFSLVPGIPFLLAGNYVLWGRFVADARLKRRTYYAITNRRVLFLQRGWKTKLRGNPHD